MGVMSQKLRAELTRLVHWTLDKIALHVIYSRLYILPEMKAAKPLPNRDQDLNSLDNVGFKDHFNEWTLKRNSPLFISFFSQPRGGEGSSRILLEKWKIFFEKPGSHSKLLEKDQYKAAFRTLVRAIICLSRTLPTYRFLHTAYQENYGTVTHIIEFDGVLEQDPAFDDCEVKNYEFADIDLSFGHTSVGVCYRSDCSSLMPKTDKIEIPPRNRGMDIPQSGNDRFGSRISSDCSSLTKFEDTNNTSRSTTMRNRSYSATTSFSPSTSHIISPPFQNPVEPPFKPQLDLSELFLGESLVQSSVDSSSFQSSQGSFVSGLASNSLPKIGSLSSKGLSLSVSPFKDSPVARGTLSTGPSKPSRNLEMVELPIEKSFLFQEESSSYASDLFTQSRSSEVFADSFHSSDEDIDDFITSCINASTRSQEEADKL